ncbi:MAG: heavy metal translocating P-type ATPase, partial [Geminicoccaceae bacterium]
MSAALCSHCFLPIRSVGQLRQIDGEEHRFCCYGCCLAYQVAHDQSEESDAVRLLIRFGVGAFLAMNIMLFSLLLYTGAIDPADHRLLGIIHLLLWGMATPALVILGGPFVAETWRELRCGRLAPSALIVLGAGSAYIYSSISILIGAEHVYFDTLAMVLVLFTLGRYVEAVGRARAVRSLAPMLAAERQSVAVLENGAERLCPACDVTPGTVVLIRPGERIGVDGSVIEG